MKISRRYVQPPRMESYAPRQTYSPPKKILDTRTTYHLSYLNENEPQLPRSKPFYPPQNLNISPGTISDDTTTKMSYKANWTINRTKPIKPKKIVSFDRKIVNGDPVEYVTTAKHDFIGKIGEKQKMIIPSGSIRISNGSLDGMTTSKLSYLNPGFVQPAEICKPKRTYYPNVDQSISKDTTQKLSFQPFSLPKREIYPWSQKSIYRPPETSMEGQTTYGKSFAEVDCSMKEKPILPRSTNFFPSGGEFFEKTNYRETFQPRNSQPVVPIIPCSNISFSAKQMSSDTTTKLSYQPVRAEKRLAILPRHGKVIEDGPMHCETTTSHDFTLKNLSKVNVIIPSNNIKIVNRPFEGKTTTSLSFVNPGLIMPVPSFKPDATYNRLDAKVEGDTVNKLSYQTWEIQPKEDFPWARQRRYEPPKKPMIGDSIYHMSYPVPGYYIEDSGKKSTTKNQINSQKVLAT
ncbi:uncharacterized protein LOC122508944 [Leptopilina heterotoma]|uniref:uncharacterized protein LOC122508944 n=1 Tax=Leptopilina heterotoma TaxID=63436 RepID=UPI001CA7D3A4|nr:uncharacterized protein LOC122508944 [Leptopilina heterotoma]